MEYVIGTLEDRVKDIENRLEDEKILAVRTIDKLTNINLQVERYESVIVDYKEAIRVLREASA